MRVRWAPPLLGISATHLTHTLSPRKGAEREKLIL